MWGILLRARELMRSFARKEEKPTAIIMLEISDATVQNLVAQELCLVAAGLWPLGAPRYHNVNTRTCTSYYYPPTLIKCM
jgi:hypothetical protein